MGAHQTTPLPAAHLGPGLPDLTTFEAAPASTIPSPTRLAIFATALREMLGAELYDAWFTRLVVERIDDAMAQCTVPTPFLRSWILSHYEKPLRAALARSWPDVTRVQLTVRSAARAGAVPPVPTPSLRTPVAPPPPVEASSKLCATFSLAPDHVFERISIGPSNADAVRVARALFDVEQTSVRRLVITGGRGCGKTHLAEACVHAVRARGRAATSIHGSDLASALRAATPDALATEMRRLHLVAIDDLSAIKGPAVAAAFASLLRLLSIDGGPSLVMTIPGLLSDLRDDAAQSRLAEMTSVSLREPGLQERRDLLDLFATQEGLAPLAPAIRDIIAERAGWGTRGLRGVVRRLVQSREAPAHEADLQAMVGDLLVADASIRVHIQTIQAVVAARCDVTRLDLVSHRRTARVVRPRQIAMYLAKVLTVRSLPEIGRRFGNRDHTTVLHAIRKVEGLMGADPAVRAEVDSLRLAIEEESRNSGGRRPAW